MYCKSRIHHVGWLIPLPTNLKPFALALLLPKLQFRFSGASSEQSSQDPCEWDAFASCHQWWHCQTAQECASSRCLKAGARFVSVMFCWLAIDFGASFTFFGTWWDSPDLYVPPVLEIAWESRMADAWALVGQVCGRLTGFGDICLEEVWYQVELPFRNSWCKGGRNITNFSKIYYMTYCHSYHQALELCFCVTFVKFFCRQHEVVRSGWRRLFGRPGRKEVRPKSTQDFLVENVVSLCFMCFSFSWVEFW